jgi:sulfonate transport system substrate-binding protein
VPQGQAAEEAQPDARQLAVDLPAAAVSERLTVAGLVQAITEPYLSRAAFSTPPVMRYTLAERQAATDTFFELKLIPKKLNLLHAAPVDLE